MTDSATRISLHDLPEIDLNPPKLDPPIKECPHCGSDLFHIRLAVSGTIREHHRFDHRPACIGDMWESAITRQHKRAYCSDCERPIARVTY